MYKEKTIDVQEKKLSFITIKLSDIEVVLLNYGATIYDIKTKDRNGEFGSVVLKYQNIEDYLKNSIYLNTTVGPLAGRTKAGRFEINGKVFQLDKNDGGLNNLHGGKGALSFKFFTYQIQEQDDKVIVTMKHVSEDGDCQYPGKQVYEVTYTIINSEVKIDYRVSTDTDVVMNMTNHAYFNLSGSPANKIFDHEFYLDANQVVVTNKENVPIGKTPAKGYLDCQKLATVRSHFYPGIENSEIYGIDHQFFVNNPSIEKPSAYLKHQESGRVLSVYSTCPVIVCYTHSSPGPEGLVENVHQEMHQAICFEAQYVSNGINVDGFNDSILRKEETYKETIIYRFGTL